MTRFRPNPRFRTELNQSRDMQHALLEIGGNLADTATLRGRKVDPDYKAVAVVEGDTIQVQANSRSKSTLNTAGWIEYGTPHLPAAAPIRGGASSLGLKLR